MKTASPRLTSSITVAEDEMLKAYDIFAKLLDEQPARARQLSAAALALAEQYDLVPPVATHRQTKKGMTRQ